MLAELMKDDNLNDVERNIFDILATVSEPYSVRELVRVVLGWNSKYKGRNAKLELEIRDALESFQGRAVPIVQQSSTTYYLADNLEVVVKMIKAREKEIQYSQHKLAVLWINYGRQVDLYHKLKNDGAL